MTAALFSDSGCRRVVSALRTKMRDQVLQGHIMHALLTYFRHQELDGKQAFCRASLMAARKLRGQRSLELFSRVDTELMRVTPLSLYHWMGSAYQERVRKKDKKVKFSMVFGGLVFPVGYREGLLLRFEQAVFNPLKPLVLKNLLARDITRDFPHVDFFGRVGIWRLSDDVWSGLLSILEHFCRKLTETVSRADLSAYDLTTYEIQGGFFGHLVGMLDYPVEERIRAQIKQAGDQENEEVDFLAILVCVQVCFCVDSARQIGIHVC